MAETPALYFADISEFQETAILPQVPLIIVRATNGYRVDNWWEAHRDAARANCVARIWYAFLVADRDPSAQADELMAAAPLDGPTEGYMCDSEEASWAPWPGSNYPEQQIARQHATEIFMARILEVCKVVCTQYSGAYDLSLAPRLSAGPVIAADYDAVPVPKHLAWQYSDGSYHPAAGPMPIVWSGIGACDTSVYYGTATATLVTEALTAFGVAPPPPVNPPPVVSPQEETMLYVVATGPTVGPDDDPHKVVAENTYVLSGCNRLFVPTQDRPTWQAALGDPKPLSCAGIWRWAHD